MRRGRPRNTWHQDLLADTKRMGIPWNQLEEKAQDRELWRSLVDVIGKYKLEVIGLSTNCQHVSSKYM